MRTATCRGCGDTIEFGHKGGAPQRCGPCREEYRRAYHTDYERRRSADPEYRERKRQAMKRYYEKHGKRPEDKVRRYAQDEARERGVTAAQVLREWRA